MASVTILNTGSMINPRDDSFSSYLNLVRESFSLETTTTIPTARTTRSPFPITSTRRRSSDGEIDIFGAEKYFNGMIEHRTTDIITTLPDHNKDNKKPRSSARSRSRRSAATASVCSESSAGNSRTGLLLRQRSGGGGAAADRNNKLLRVLLCNCSGEKSVINTDEVENVRSERDRSVLEEIRLASEMRMNRLRLGFADHHHDLLINRAKIVNSKVIQEKDEYDDEDDDITSESSSDLFEINSISIKHPFFDPVATTDETAAVYEPSEASIEWSVVTASAANLSSAASEFEEPRKKGRKLGYNNKKGLLTGCVSHKAVNIATADSYRNNKVNIIKRAGHTGTSEMVGMPARMGRERNIRYRIESVKKAEARPAPVPPVSTRSHTRVQARQPIYVRS